MAGQTMLDKIWARYVVATGPGGRDLLYVVLRKPRSPGYGQFCFHDLRVRPDGRNAGPERG